MSATPGPNEDESENVPLEGNIPKFDPADFRARDGSTKSTGQYGNTPKEGMNVGELRKQTYAAHAGKNSGDPDSWWNSQAKLKQDELITYLIQDYNLRQAAKAVGISYSTARAYVRDPRVMEQLRSLSETVYRQLYSETLERKVEAHQRILEMADEALGVLEQLLQSPNDNIRLKAAESVLDRHGEVPKTSKTTGTQTNVTISGAEVMTAIAAMKDLEGRKGIAAPRLIAAETFEKEPNG